MIGWSIARIVSMPKGAVTCSRITSPRPTRKPNVLTISQAGPEQGMFALIMNPVLGRFREAWLWVDVDIANDRGASRPDLILSEHEEAPIEDPALDRDDRPPGRR